MKPAATAHPYNPWLAHTVRIADIAPATPGVFTCDLVFEDPAAAQEYSYCPGQFNMLYLPGLGEIAISISGDPDIRACVAHTIREAGNVTRRWSTSRRYHHRTAAHLAHTGRWSSVVAETSYSWLVVLAWLLYAPSSATC